MPESSETKIATADALTLLLHNQHAIAAAIEEVAKWLSENGNGSVAANATAAMETLDTNAQRFYGYTSRRHPHPPPYIEAREIGERHFCGTSEHEGDSTRLD
jgi:hypothetical protein